jgi:hypothetical protein
MGWFSSPGRGKKHLPLLYIVQTGSETHSTSYTMGTGTLSLWVNQQEREADHSTLMVQLHLHCPILHGMVVN